VRERGDGGVVAGGAAGPGVDYVVEEDAVEVDVFLGVGGPVFVWW
jgi:hypothetical protein